jgi:hypothetical protein
MPMPYSEAYPLLPPAPSATKSGQGWLATRDPSPSATVLHSPSTKGDTPDPSYWTAYDHYMIEREAHAMRRVYAWTMLANAWSSLRPWLKV